MVVGCLITSVKKYITWLVVVCCYVGSSYADDRVTLFNHTDIPVYVGMYYVKSNLFGVSRGPAVRYGAVVEVPAHAQRTLVRPEWKFFIRNREIVFSIHPEGLKAHLTKKEYKLCSVKPAGKKYGSRYHIDRSDGVVTIHGDLDFKILQPVTASIIEMSGRIFHKITDYFKQQPYIQQQAFVRHGAELCADEQAYLVRRSEKTKSVLERVVSHELPEYAVPRLGVCLGGGSVRAALCSYGLLLGLDEIGVLDAITYEVGCSGATWLIASHCVAGTSVQGFRDDFVKAVTHESVPVPAATADTFLQKYMYKQPLGLVDLYGVYLAHKFLQSVASDIGRQRTWFSDLRDRTDTGLWMLPLCTALEITKSARKPVWYTFFPYEIGSDELELYVPTWALGRKFYGGVSTDSNNPPELRLGFLMALWGSALSSTFRHMYEYAIQSHIESAAGRALIKNILKQTVGELQFAPVNVVNPFYAMEHTDYQDVEYLTFVDPGYENNVPFVPLLQKKRAVDIIIVLDASRQVHKDYGAVPLEKAAQYAQEHNCLFPSIDSTKISIQAVQVFMDDNPEAPIIVYVVPTRIADHSELGDPAIEFESVYKTARFTYSKNEADRLIDLVRLNIIDNKDMIIEAIKQKINQKMMH